MIHPRRLWYDSVTSEAIERVLIVYSLFLLTVACGAPIAAYESPDGSFSIPILEDWSDTTDEVATEWEAAGPTNYEIVYAATKYVYGSTFGIRVGRPTAQLIVKRIEVSFLTVETEESASLAWALSMRDEIPEGAEMSPPKPIKVGPRTGIQALVRDPYAVGLHTFFVVRDGVGIELICSSHPDLFDLGDCMEVVERLQFASDR